MTTRSTATLTPQPIGPPRASLLPALPAILAVVAIALGCLLLILVRPSHATLIDRYQQLTDAALTAGDAETARVGAARLMQLDAGDPSNRQRQWFANAIGKSSGR